MSWLKEDDRGRVLLGTILSIDSTEVAEIVADSGLDWVWVDAEHSALDISRCQTLTQVLQKKVRVVIRCPSSDEFWIKKALDTGCDGVIAPQIHTSEQAARVVAYSKYPPLGSRSVGISRAHGYGSRFSEYLEVANRRVATIVQIESREAVENFDSIVNVPGIDGVLIGPYDLSGSLGVLGDVSHPQVKSSLSRVVSTCKVMDMPVGVFVANAEAFRSSASYGFRFVAVGIDTMLLSSTLRSMVSELRGSPPSP